MDLSGAVIGLLTHFKSRDWSYFALIVDINWPFHAIFWCSDWSTDASFKTMIESTVVFCQCCYKCGRLFRPFLCCDFVIKYFLIEVWWTTWCYFLLGLWLVKWYYYLLWLRLVNNCCYLLLGLWLAKWYYRLLWLWLVNNFYFLQCLWLIN